MIIYSGSKGRFVEDARTNVIHTRIQTELLRKLSRRVGESEAASWRNSMQFMSHILNDPQIPEDAGVSIEYNIPGTGNRIDFILTGSDQAGVETVVIVELKQWSDVRLSPKDGTVTTWLRGAHRDVPHPSYQAWTYASLIEDFNETVRDEQIALRPCAYLHNLDVASVIRDQHYDEHLAKAPVFISSDGQKLSEFLKRFIRFGDSKNILYRIEHGRIKPSKSLADCLASMLKGNREFVLIDDQKVLFETALDLAYRAEREAKQVLIVSGGPGTGKSVVAINLLVELTNREKVVQYVSKNAAPREVYEARLTGTLTRGRISNLFKSSGVYYDCEPDSFGALIVDEAHRLNAKSGMFANRGENQIKEIISASRLSVFFVDEAQVVTFQDIGEIGEIERWAKVHGAAITHGTLTSQFRCNGSDGYLSWIDNTLQIRATENRTLDGINYEMIVVDTPSALRSMIEAKNEANNKARMVAGYCWEWKSKKNPTAMDIVFPETGFQAQWNLATGESPWLISKDSVKEVGCIHTCQGLELDYVGVIVGPDLVIRDGMVHTDASKRSRHDKSIRGYVALFEADPAGAKRRADRIIKNTYRTLMTRGQKGCYLFSVDPETQAYFKERSARHVNDERFGP